MLDAKNDGLGSRRRPECCARQAGHREDLERLAPPVDTGRPPAVPTVGDVSGHDEIGRHEPASRAEQPSDQRGRDRERWIRHDAERPARKSQIGGVNLDHGHRLPRKPAAKLESPLGVKLDRDHTRAGSDERGGEGPRASTDV
jgi:hypothetical protein